MRVKRCGIGSCDFDALLEMKNITYVDMFTGSQSSLSDEGVKKKISLGWHRNETVIVPMLCFPRERVVA